MISRKKAQETLKGERKKGGQSKTIKMIPLNYSHPSPF
jgi:hypothetical protein